MEHLHDILLILAFVVPFLLSGTILIGSKGSLPRLVMGLALINAFYAFFANYFYFKKLIEVYIVLHSLHIASVLWLFPSIYLYVRSIVVTKDEFKKDLMHLLPGTLFGVVSAILFYGLLKQDERIYYLLFYRTGIEFFDFRLKLIYGFRMVDVAVIIAQVIFYSVVMIKIPAKYNEKLKEEYSNIDKFSINWIRWFNIALVLVGLLSILFYVFNPLDAANDLFLVCFLFIISLFMWVLGIWSFMQKSPGLVSPYLVPVFQDSKRPTEDSENILAKALLDYFEKEQPFLNPELNLTSVCRHIGTNRTYLSNLINKNFGMNFNSFVNQYRVAYVFEYLKNSPGTSNEVLTSLSGFGSVSSFKRAIKNAGKQERTQRL